MAELAIIEHRYLRSAIEFAVNIAAASEDADFTLDVPDELQAEIGKSRISTRSLGRLRRAIEDAPEFREKLAAGAIPGVVDEIAVLWLRRPPGWEAVVQQLVVGLECAERELEGENLLRKSEKRRHAAEQTAERSRSDQDESVAKIVAQRKQIDGLGADLIKADDLLDEMRAEVIDARNESRHARDREAAALAKLEATRAEVTSSSASSNGPSVVPPGETSELPLGLDRYETEIASLADAARKLADQLSALRGVADPATSADRESSTRSRPHPARRVAMKLPGGVSASSAEAAVFYARSDAAMLIDGYNVAKLGWPELSLEEQRTKLLDIVENMVRRFRTNVIVVFDGASIVGAHAPRGRLVRVLYSPSGVIADDVIRDEVARLPNSDSVVVVTNDTEILRDVRARGANTLSSYALLAAL